MAHIAETADMSPGLIYRYFESKSAIILAIIERQLELARHEIANLHDAVDLPHGIWETTLPREERSDGRINPALYVEMSAEACHDAQIQAAVREADLILRTDFARWLGRSREQGGLGLTPAKARAAALMVQCLVDGLRVRQLREPDIDRGMLKRALAEFLPAMLSPRD
jgi:AcrR family transcriptional regulator